MTANAKQYEITVTRSLGETGEPVAVADSPKAAADAVWEFLDALPALPGPKDYEALAAATAGRASRLERSGRALIGPLPDGRFLFVAEAVSS